MNNESGRMEEKKKTKWDTRLSLSLERKDTIYSVWLRVEMVWRNDADIGGEG